MARSGSSIGCYFCIELTWLPEPVPPAAAQTFAYKYKYITNNNNQFAYLNEIYTGRPNGLSWKIISVITVTETD